MTQAERMVARRAAAKAFRESDAEMDRRALETACPICRGQLVKPPDAGPRKTGRQPGRTKYCSAECAKAAHQAIVNKWQKGEDAKAKKQAWREANRVARSAYNRTYYLKNVAAYKTPGHKRMRMKYMRVWRAARKAA